MIALANEDPELAAFLKEFSHQGSRLSQFAAAHPELDVTSYWRGARTSDLPKGIKTIGDLARMARTFIWIGPRAIGLPYL